MTRDERVRAALPLGVRNTRGWLNMPCMFCLERVGKEGGKKLGLSESSGVYYCFRCGVKGKLDGYQSDAAEGTSRPLATAEDLNAPDGYIPLYGDTSYSLAPAREFLANRGIDQDLIREAKIGAANLGKCRGRVIVPILGSDGETWLGWSARSWLPRGAVKMPYMNAQNMLKGTFLFNGEALYQNPEEPLFTVEGTFDNLSLWPHAVAFLGKPSQTQEDQLVECPRPIICCLDGDAWRESEVLCWKLRQRGKKAGFLRFPPGEDPSSMGREWVFSQAKHVQF